MADRRFGSRNKFGTSNQFGASVIDSYLAYGLEIDWDGDGVFDGSNETQYLCGFQTDRGRTVMLRSTGEGYEAIPTGSATFTLWNDDGRFNARNSSSALYPNVAPGKEVRFRVRDMVTGTITNEFYGFIDDIVPTGYGERPKVNIYVKDGWTFLRSYTARVAVQQNISIDSALSLVLDAVGWSPRWGRSLGVSSDSVRYWWASGGKSAAAECEDLINSFFGYFFIAADGSARFIPRTSVSASVADFDQSEVMKDIPNPQPWQNLRNVMQLTVHPRAESGTVQLFEQFGDAVEIANGDTLEDFIGFTYNGANVPALSIVTPVANVHYTINSNSSGSGSDVSGSCTVTVTNLGDRAKREIVNNSGATAYVVTFVVNGVAVYENNTLDVFYPTNPDSVTNPRRFYSDLIWQQNSNRAADIVSVMGPFLATAYPYPVIQIESYPAKQFGKDLFDILTFTSEKLGLSGQSYRIGGIHHESLSENLQRVLTRFYLEPYVAGGDYGSFPLTWGTSTFGW